MSRTVTHKKIVDLHETIANAHVDINGFYRFDISEIEGQFRNGVGMPALLLESHSNEISSETKAVSNFSNRRISFMLLDHAGAVDNYAKQNEVLDKLENVGLDICSYLLKCAKDKEHWLFMLFDINSYELQKVGPLFDNMYGWNILYTLKNHEKMCFDPDMWNFI